VDLYQIIGYLTGLVLIRPEIEPTTLFRTTVLIHFLDAILCRVIAGHSGRPRNLWTAAGSIFGIWAVAILFLLPEKAPRHEPAGESCAKEIAEARSKFKGTPGEIEP
jgi:hypothetical protein